MLDGTGKEGLRFVCESPVDDWSMTYMCIRMLMTESAKKEREKLRKKRKNVTENN